MERKRIISQLEGLNKSHQELWGYLSSLDHDLLHYKPNGNRWSILEILQHLYLSESLSLQYIDKKSQAPDQLTKPSLKSRFQERIIIPFLKYVPSYKAPKMVSSLGFQENFDLQTARGKFSDIHEKLGQSFRNYPDTVIQNNVYRHPVMGRVRLRGMMNFHRYHLERHRKQMMGNVKAFHTG